MQDEYYNLVIVDDECSIRNSLEQLFPWKELGFNVSGVFPNGLKALSFILANKVDAILTDIRMPIIDGLELTSTLYKYEIDIPVILLSAYDDFAYAKRAIELGATDYLVKPVSYYEVLDTFAKLKKKLDDKNYKELTRENLERAIYLSLKDFSKEEIASIFCCDIKTLKCFVQNEYSMTISELINKLRMKKAKTMLCITGIRVQEISEALGYSNANNFTRAFLQYYGEKPTEWRNGH